MTIRKILATACGALVVAMGSAQAASAQESLRPGEDPAATAQQQAGERNTTPAERARANRRERAPREQTPEQTKAAVESALAAAGQTCQVVEAKHLGQNEERQMIYETTCADAPGYVVLASTPPQVYNCMELAGTAYKAKQADPNADAGQQCTLPANQNGLQLAAGWAQQAGISCTVDQVLAIGKGEGDNLVYEIGCNGADGYWLEQKPTGWTAQDCMLVSAGGGQCLFTAPEEQTTQYTAKLANTDASDCTVSEVRLMGRNANGLFAEVKCAAEGEGYILRMTEAGAVQQVYACRIAQRIGGGCTLTPVAAPAAAPTPSGGRP